VDTDFRVLHINETSAVLNGLSVAERFGQCVADVGLPVSGYGSRQTMR
jgi:hypothetical protein